MKKCAAVAAAFFLAGAKRRSFSRRSFPTSDPFKKFEKISKRVLTNQKRHAIILIVHHSEPMNKRTNRDRAAARRARTRNGGHGNDEGDFEHHGISTYRTVRDRDEVRDEKEASAYRTVRDRDEVPGRKRCFDIPHGERP